MLRAREARESTPSNQAHSDHRQGGAASSRKVSRQDRVRVILLVAVTCLWYCNERLAVKLIIEQDNYDLKKAFQHLTYKGINTLEASRLFLDSPGGCASVAHFGNMQDGGWSVCTDVLPPTANTPGGGCVVYSFGIEHDTSFDESFVARYPGCTVYAFDPSIGRETGVFVRARGGGGGHVFRALVLVKRSALQQAEDEMMRACACTHVNLERTDPSQTLAQVGDSILIVGKATILEPASSFSTSASTAQTAGRSGAQKLGR